MSFLVRRSPFNRLRNEPNHFSCPFHFRISSVPSLFVFAILPLGPRRGGIPTYFVSSWNQQDAGIPSTKRKRGTAGIRTADLLDARLVWRPLHHDAPPFVLSQNFKKLKNFHTWNLWMRHLSWGRKNIWRISQISHVMKYNKFIFSAFVWSNCQWRILNHFALGFKFSNAKPNAVKSNFPLWNLTFLKAGEFNLITNFFFNFATPSRS